MDKNTPLAPNALAWASRSPNMPPVAEEEMCAEVDEPPEASGGQLSPAAFQKTSIRKPSECHSSLLTRALLTQSEYDPVITENGFTIASGYRRRSMTSNVSVASTADLTSDTGLSSPSRANTPSPPPPEMHAHRLHEPTNNGPKLKFGPPPARPTQEAEEAPRKKSIMFACFAKPEQQPSESKSGRPQQHQPIATTHVDPEAPRKPRIKFACPTPAADGPKQDVDGKPNGAAIRRHRSPPPPIFRQRSNEGQVPTMNGAPNLQVPAMQDVSGSAYDEPTEDDWIREEDLSPKRRITIDDTLKKENHIRQLAQEAEDEEDAEEDEEDANVDQEEGDEDEDEDGDDDDEDEDDEDDDEDEDEDEDDGDEDNTECGSFEADDGYHTDEETGFAESEEDEEDGLRLWSHGLKPVVGLSPGGLVPARRASAPDHQSDSSTAPGQGGNPVRRRRSRRASHQDVALELPDSTDFVCGTFDEDRPMEEAFLTRRAALKAQKRHLIPQDIDPSFPTSDIEDGDGEELFNPVHNDSEDEMWKMDDVRGEDRAPRRNARGASPRRYHSPPPKPRGRSPRAVFDKHSPRRMRSPCPKRLLPTGVSPPPNRARGHVKFGGIGGGAAFPQTKSLPRPAAMLTLIRSGKKAKVPTSDQHVRGAVDIVKGLEHKRQRRNEKYHQKYCNRARRGQIPERKATPGRGATKMRELGLLMAGKTDRGNYVLSV